MTIMHVLLQRERYRMTEISTDTFFQTKRVEQFNFSPQTACYNSLYNRLISTPTRALEPILSYLFSQHVPLNVQIHGKTTFSLAPKVTVIGDVHGELFGLIENLHSAGLINDSAQWTGGTKIFVQLGDVIDRGLFSEECWIYLENLQKQAKASGGQVIRLLGNHELNVLEGHLGLARFFIQDVDRFKEKLKIDILEKKVQLAYTDGKRLFVHAGLTSSLREKLLQEIEKKKNLSLKDIYIEDLVTYLNELLIEAVESNDFSHSIFQAGYLRGGPHSQGGVLWADMQELLQSKNARDLPQVAGHNPPRCQGDPPIRITDSQGFICADAGMNFNYGGQRAYVVFEHPDIKVRYKIPDNQWGEEIAHDILGLTQEICYSSPSLKP